MASLITTEINVYEVALNDPFYAPESALEAVSRAEVLWACLYSAKTFFRLHFSISPRISLGLSLCHWGQFGYALLVASRLVIFEYSSWDLIQVRQVFNLFDVLNKQLALLDDVLQMQSVNGLLNEEHDLFCDFVRRLRQICWYNIKLAGDAKKYTQGMMFGPQPLGGTGAVDSAFTVPPDYIDDAF